MAVELIWLRRFSGWSLLLASLVLWVSPAVAADSPAGAPNADTQPLHASAPDTQTADCLPRPRPAVGAPSSIVVELDPDTLWRPRGSEVRFIIRGPKSPVAVKQVQVCFAWSSPDGHFEDIHHPIGSPQVRSVYNTDGLTEYGAIVPGLGHLPSSDWWPRRLINGGRYVFTGAGTVPVADMIVEVEPMTGEKVVIAIQVGVTNVLVAWVVVILVALLIWAVMYGIAKYRQIDGRNLLLRIIATQDGYASLSQLQIVLWTLVVGMSAIYVMTLSGNLISISDGTLILLGIASGAALAARVPQGPVAPAQSPPLSPPVSVMPEWSDLVVPNRQTREIDVTRLQMLAFTLITAAFVVLKVVVNYEIPSIPTNFLLLMGISNGVYVAGRRLPSTPRDPAPPQG